jgi:EmrB/QacA subfamily drug resistance transporter
MSTTTAPVRSAARPQAAARPRWVLALTSVASLMVALDALIVSTALGSVRRSLGASLSEVGWTVDAYALSFAVLLMAGSVLGERLGRRTVFMVGVGLFTAASAACALAPSISWLIAARALQGAGAAGVMPVGLALLGVEFTGERRAWAVGIYSAVTGLSMILGPVLGGTITQGLDWRWVFWLNVPVGIAVVLLSARRVRESHGASTRLDVRGLSLLTAAAFGIVWALVHAGSAGWGSGQVFVSLAAGVLLGGAFVMHERHGKLPMMPARLFASRAFTAGNLTMFLLNGALLGAVFLMAQFQQVALAQGPLDAGLRILPWGAAAFLTASQAVSLARRFGRRTVIVTGLMLQAAGLAWLAIEARPGLAFAQMIAPMVLAGAGFAAAVTTTQVTVLGAVSPPDIGTASGILSTLRQLGGALGLAIALTAFGAAGGYRSAHAFSDGFTAAITACAALSLLGAITALALPRDAHA